jgi:hypothetical protein
MRVLAGPAGCPVAKVAVRHGNSINVCEFFERQSVHAYRLHHARVLRPRPWQKCRNWRNSPRDIFGLAKRMTGRGGPMPPPPPRISLPPLQVNLQNLLRQDFVRSVKCIYRSFGVGSIRHVFYHSPTARTCACSSASLAFIAALSLWYSTSSDATRTACTHARGEITH